MRNLLFLCLTLVPYYGQANSLDTALIACKKIADDTDRLACFDQIQLQRVEPAMDVKQPDAVVAVKNQAVLTENDFGLEHKAAVKDRLQPSVPMVLKKHTKTPFGVQIFNFENGQTWRQVSAETFNPKVGKTYMLERAALNSFFLSEEGSGRKTRVRRDK
jgi:hypothetical protein